jgi:hypothetical protein
MGSEVEIDVEAKSEDAQPSGAGTLGSGSGGFLLLEAEWLIYG